MTRDELLTIAVEDTRNPEQAWDFARELIDKDGPYWPWHFLKKNTHWDDKDPTVMYQVLLNLEQAGALERHYRVFVTPDKEVKVRPEEMLMAQMERRDTVMCESGHEADISQVLVHFYETEVMP